MVTRPNHWSSDDAILARLAPQKRGPNDSLHKWRPSRWTLLKGTETILWSMGQDILGSQPLVNFEWPCSPVLLRR
jgi:hypothetical protein